MLLRFRFRNEYPISLFGPEDHWGFFISIPHIRLGIGDELAVKLWDRDGPIDTKVAAPLGEYMGEARLRFDGTLPIMLYSDFFTLRCSAMTAAQALAAARSRLQALDGVLAKAFAWHSKKDDHDRKSNPWAEEASSAFGFGSFRYAAGFLGWEHLEIQKRLKLYDKLFIRDALAWHPNQNSWNWGVNYAAEEGRGIFGFAAELPGSELPELQQRRKLYDEIATRDAKERQELFAQLIRQAPPARGAEFATSKFGTGQVAFVTCTDVDCIVHIQAGNALLAHLCTSAPDARHAASASIDSRGSFSKARVQFRKEDLSWQDCVPGQLPGTANKVQLLLPRKTALLWIKLENEKAVILRLPSA